MIFFWLLTYRYGAVLEKFKKQDPSLMGRIKGCIVDSAPVAAPDPQVNNLYSCVGYIVNTIRCVLGIHNKKYYH